MSLLNRLVYCSDCGKRMKHKKRSKTSVYVCSKYDNYGSKYCNRNQVNEDEVVWLIKKHLNTSEVGKSEITDNVNKVFAYNDGFKIFYIDKSESFLNSKGMSV